MILKLKTTLSFLVAYIKHLDMTCMYRRAFFHNMSVPTGSEFEQSKQWCNKNSNCGAFIVYQERAYFTVKDCELNLFYRANRVAYIKQQYQNNCVE